MRHQYALTSYLIRNQITTNTYSIRDKSRTASVRSSRAWSWWILNECGMHSECIRDEQITNALWMRNRCPMNMQRMHVDLAMNSQCIRRNSRWYHKKIALQSSCICHAFVLHSWRIVMQPWWSCDARLVISELTRKDIVNNYSCIRNGFALNL